MASFPMLIDFQAGYNILILACYVCWLRDSWNATITVSPLAIADCFYIILYRVIHVFSRVSLNFSAIVKCDSLAYNQDHARVGSVSDKEIAVKTDESLGPLPKIIWNVMVDCKNMFKNVIRNMLHVILIQFEHVYWLKCNMCVCFQGGNLWSNPSTVSKRLAPFACSAETYFP